MIKRISISIIVITGLFFNANSQNKYDNIQEENKNSISINLYGDATLVSLSFERLLMINRLIYLSGKIGIGKNCDSEQMPVGIRSNRINLEFTTISYHLTFNLNVAHHQKRRAYLEIGVGATNLNKSLNNNHLIYPILGIRAYPFQSLNYRIYTHLPYSLVRCDRYHGRFIPFGFSVGYSF